MYYYVLPPINAEFLCMFELHHLCNKEYAKEAVSSLSLMGKIKEWDGTFKVGPYFFAIPSIRKIQLGLFWQQTDSLVFVISPVKLSHLEEVDIVRKGEVK